MEIAALTNQEDSHRRDTAGHRVASRLNGSCLGHGVNNKHRPNSAGRSKYVSLHVDFLELFIYLFILLQTLDYKVKFEGKRIACHVVHLFVLISSLPPSPTTFICHGFTKLCAVDNLGAFQFLRFVFNS